jgi:hypothetical protein
VIDHISLDEIQQEAEQKQLPSISETRLDGVMAQQLVGGSA